jgi:hypothetical protein
VRNRGKGPLDLSRHCETGRRSHAYSGPVDHWIGLRRRQELLHDLERNFFIYIWNYGFVVEVGVASPIVKTLFQIGVQERAPDMIDEFDPELVAKCPYSLTDEVIGRTITEKENIDIAARDYMTKSSASSFSPLFVYMNSFIPETAQDHDIFIAILLLN